MLVNRIFFDNDIVFCLDFSGVFVSSELALEIEKTVLQSKVDRDSSLFLREEKK